jgi:hypothetical protein
MVYFTISSVLEVLFMLRDWTPHSDYQDKLQLKMLLYCETQRSRLVALDKSISKLYLLNLDNLLPVIKPLYSDLGRFFLMFAGLRVLPLRRRPVTTS